MHKALEARARQKEQTGLMMKEFPFHQQCSFSVRILPVLCPSQFESSLLRAAFLVAFFGAFRVGELVARSRADSFGCASSQEYMHWEGASLRIWLSDEKGMPLHTVSGFQTGKYLLLVVEGLRSSEMAFAPISGLRTGKKGEPLDLIQGRETESNNNVLFSCPMPMQVQSL